MTDKEKIRAFIERRKESLKPCGGQGLVVTQLMRELCDDFLSFIDSMQKEEIPPKFPLISQKKCMYTKDSYTDEDRKVLCDGCKEECEYAQKKEPAPKILEDMLNAKTPAESLGISAEEHDKIIDLCLYGKEPEMVDIDDLPKEEPVSEELEKVAIEICSKVLKAETITIDGYEYVVLSDAEECFKAGANYVLEQIEKLVKFNKWAAQDLYELIEQLKK